MRVTLCPYIIALVLCCHGASASAQDQAAQETGATLRFTDLRAERWRKTSLANTSAGAVQHGGDELFGTGGVVAFLAKLLAPQLPTDTEVQLKTADIRLFVPDTRVDATQLSTVQAVVPSGAVVAAPIALLISGFSKNKSASAVFCVSIAGKDYLGNDARLFRVGPDAELKESIAAAASTLAKNVASGLSTDSPACAPGWEGGQPQKE